jgi:hypothetical protein
VTADGINQLDAYNKWKWEVDKCLFCMGPEGKREGHWYPGPVGDQPIAHLKIFSIVRQEMLSAISRRNKEMMDKWNHGKV